MRLPAIQRRARRTRRGTSSCGSRSTIAASVAATMLLVFVLVASNSGNNVVVSARRHRHKVLANRGRLPFLSLPDRIGKVPGDIVEESAILPSTRVLERQRLLAQELRGGAAAAADDSDYEEDEDFSSDDDEDDVMFGLDDMDEFYDVDGVAESDFAEDNTLERMVGAWNKTPPLTKMYLSASFVATMYGYLFNKNEFPKFLLLEWKAVLTRLQIWRLITAFLNFGPMGLGYLMTAHFVWTYMSTLERLNHNRPYDFWIMILFGQLSMVIGYPLLRLSPGFLGHNLSTFLVYIWSRYHEGIQVGMFDLFNARAELLPWFFLAQTFLLEGELPVLDFLGIVFGHIYHHCKTVGILRAPDELVRWYNGNSKAAVRIRELYKPISSDFEM